MLAVVNWLISAAARLWSLTPRQRKRRLSRQVASLVDQHLAHLIRVRAQALSFDRSGRPAFQDWNDEIDRFLNSQVTGAIGESEHRLLQKHRSELKLMIAVRVASAIGSHPLYQ
jgi:hypothetical protein